VRVEGDVQLAAEVNWLTDHVRWDVEEDLARLMGDAPAHALGTAARSLALAVKQFLASRDVPGQDKAST
jgi:ubiquinone biosynthesis protein UbiJ